MNDNEPKAAVLDKSSQITAFQRSAIEQGLKLEAMGMRHSTNAVRMSAKKQLTDAKLKAPSNKVKLYDAWQAYRESLGDYATSGAIKSTLPDRYR